MSISRATGSIFALLIAASVAGAQPAKPVTSAKAAHDTAKHAAAAPAAAPAPMVKPTAAPAPMAKPAAAAKETGKTAPVTKKH